jgi:hypothetical protein
VKGRGSHYFVAVVYIAEADEEKSAYLDTAVPSAQHQRALSLLQHITHSTQHTAQSDIVNTHMCTYVVTMDKVWAPYWRC